MNFLEELRQAPTSPKAKVNVFLAMFNPCGRRLHAFVEGRDDPAFYRHHVEAAARRYALEAEIWRLNGKSEVLEARKFIEKRYLANPRVLFFVDKDHDELVGAPGRETERTLFVTSGYSVENYLVSADVIRLIMIDFWGLDSASRVILAVCDAFEQSLEQFRSGVRVWMAWALSARRRGARPCLENLKLKKLFAFESASSVKWLWPEDAAALLEMFAHDCGVELGLSNAEVASADRELAALEPMKWMRGKSELLFLVRFVDHILGSAKEAEIAPKQRTSLTLDNAVEVLAPRVSCPEDLREFLRQCLEKCGSPKVEELGRPESSGAAVS